VNLHGAQMRRARGYTVRIAGSRGAHVIATVRGDVDEARGLGAEEVYDTKAVAVVDALRASHPGKER